MIFLITALAHAGTTFNISGIENELKTNVESYIKVIPVPTGPAGHQAYLDSIREESIRALQAVGYYDANVDVSINSTDAVSDLTVSLSIETGAPIIISRLVVRLSGEGAEDTMFVKLLEQLPLKEGDVFHHGKYESIKSSLNTLAVERGYFGAEFEEAEVRLNRGDRRAEIGLLFNTASRFVFGETTLQGDDKVEQLVQSLRPYREGDPYNAKLLAEYSLTLNDTGYFKSVRVRPVLEESRDYAAPVMVTVEMKPGNSYKVGLGVNTDIGPRIKLNWSHPLANSKGHGLGADIQLSALEQLLAAYYKVPLADPVDNYLHFETGYQRLDENDTDSEKLSLAARRFWKTPNQWERIGYLEFDYEDATQGNQDDIYKFFMPGISYSRTRSRGGLNASWGDRQLFITEFASKSLGSDADLIRLHGRTKWLRSSESGHSLTFRLELGAIMTDEILDVPPSKRFFAGGDQSIRGFGYKEVAPVDNDGLLIGGKYLSVASMEVSFPVHRNWRLAAFVDAGSVTNDTSDFSDPAVGAGVGVIWKSPIGPVKLYVAKPLSDSDDSFRIHFLIGPEL